MARYVRACCPACGWTGEVWPNKRRCLRRLVRTYKGGNRQQRPPKVTVCFGVLVRLLDLAPPSRSNPVPDRLTPAEAAALDGDALDIAVAELVMGWRWFERDSDCSRGRHAWLLPPDTPRLEGAVVGPLVVTDAPQGKQPYHGPEYSTDIAAAMSVLCHARTLGLPEGDSPRWFKITPYIDHPGDYFCSLGVSGTTGRGATIAAAICRASLTLALALTPGVSPSSPPDAPPP
jgi:hypothetical protein